MYGYQLFYTQINGTETDIVRMVNISNRSVSVTLFGLEAAATYSIEMLAYADLPTERSESISVTLNGNLILYITYYNNWRRKAKCSLL